MITYRELIGAINECENAPTSYQNCAKLATFYTILDHTENESKADMGYSYDVPEYGESDFLKTITGKDYKFVFDILDELMDTLQIVNPRLYDGVMRRLKE